MPENDLSLFETTFKSSSKHRQQQEKISAELESQRQQSITRESNDGNNFNLGVIYEPFKMFPNSTATVGTAMESRKSISCNTKSRNLEFDLMTGKDVLAVANKRQKEFLVSLENYANAVARYEERQLVLKKQQQLQEQKDNSTGFAMTSSGSNLNRTTQALRRGSVVVLSKLKLLHGLR